VTTVPARLGRRQAAVYAAEHEALGGRGRRWRRVREAQEYLDALVASPWFAERWPHFVRGAVERRGSGSVYSTNAVLDRRAVDGAPTEGAVLMADGCLCQEVVLHELAHLLAPPDSGHGPEFLAVQMELVRHEMGFYAFVDYRDALARRQATDWGP
jgi:putative metallohydrolase (TIGR04338 family)